MENHGVPQEKIRRRVDEAFWVFHLEHLQDRNVYELSGGERQLISILAAWTMDTEIFLLDEPTANLDFAATRQLREILLALKQQGKTLLLSEHRLYYLTGVADEFWVMEHGRIRGRYTAEEVADFTQAQLQGLSLRTLDLGKIVVPEAVRAAETEAQSQEAKEPVMLAAEDLRFAYGARGGAKRAGKQTPPLLAGVRFAARRHEVVGLIGANGCGKTTAGKLLAGLYKPSGGAVLLDGRPQTPKKLQEQVMFIMQEAEFQFFTDSVLHELQYGHTVTPTFSERVETLLKSADMWECRQRHPFSLSGGQMQKLTLMTACLSEKPIVVLDEPTAGQDAESLETCAALIREMQKEKTVLINVVIFFASSLLYATPVTIILMPVFFALLEGVIYFMIGTKVKKPGAILLYSVVRGIMGGYLPYIVLFILSGVIAEALLWKGGYGNAKALTAGYVINQVLASIGSTIFPYAIAAKAMADQMVSDGRQDNILAASEILQSWVSAALLAAVIAAAFAGAAIGKKIVSKHLAA